MKRFRSKKPRGRGVLTALLLVLLLSAQTVYAVRRTHPVLTITGQVDGEEYLAVPVSPGDELPFGWEHSFEHVTWNEYYTILSDGTLKLTSIAVGGFGAGIPAEMDCTYRYEDGLIYMEDIEDSEFPEIRWIHSQTQVIFIAINGEIIAEGEDLPQRARLLLKVTY